MTRMPRAGRLLAPTLTVCLLTTLAWTVGAGAIDPTADRTVQAADAGPTEPIGAADDLAGVGVTLLTGDRVVFGAAVDGEPQVAFHPRDPEAPSGFSMERDGENLFVIPHDVARLVPDVLARELFNVTALAEMGYDDAGRASLPLIVEHHGTSRALAEGGPLRVTGQLESIGAAAAALDKDHAAELGRALANLNPDRGRSVARATGGATRIWLDSQVAGSATDAYLGQVGAPAAWDLGLDGDGVSIAVLDTGVDPGHPALSGQIEQQRDFTGTAPAGGDDNGHGTHVASLALGTGAGSGGARRGIAPAADLLSAKVLDAEAVGLESWVIAGMEWAAANGADVVNVSLGAPPAGPDDPLVAAVERLTEVDDVLFAVAGGNRGGPFDSPFTIGSPGVAPSAITVAAVGPDDRQAWFSSEGPTPGSYGLKPDISAPGVDIMGARVGAREGDLYTPMSGTSMATPIVAGAAALLRQQHPHWAAARIKATLVGTTDDSHWFGAWKQGSGRLDIGAAARSQLGADVASFDFGLLEHPDDAVRTREFVLTNTGDDAVTVRAEDVLTSDTWQTAPEGAVTVEPHTITVAPGASASATLTLDPEQLEDAMWQGVVTLRENGEDLLRIPVGLYDEPPRYDLRLSALDTRGDPWNPSTGLGDPNVVGNIVAFNTDTGGTVELWPDERGEATARVAPGHYSVFAHVVTPGRADDPQIMTIAGTAELLVESDTAYVLDAREAVPLGLPSVEGDSVEVAQAVGVTYRVATGEKGPALTNGVVFTPEQIVAGLARVTPTVATTTGSFEATARWQLDPEVPGRPRHGQRPDRYELLQHLPVLSGALTPHLSREDVRRLARVEQVVHPVAREGHEALTTGSTTRETRVGVVIAEPVTGPVRRSVLMTADSDVSWLHCLELEVNLWRDFCGRARSFAAGSSSTEAIGDAVHASPHQAEREPTVFRAAMGMSDGAHLSNVANLDLVESSRLRLTTPDGHEQTAEGTFGFFDIPAGLVRLRLEHAWTMGDSVRAATQTRTRWEFTSAPPDLGKEGSTIAPLLEVDYAPKVTDDGTMRARGAASFDLSFDRFVVPIRPGEDLRRITDARFWWSADRGRTWHSTRLDRRGPVEFGVRVTGPAWRRGDDLSVRVQAADADGNTIDQTNIGLVELQR